MNGSTVNFTSPELPTDLIPYFRCGLLSFNLLFGIPSRSYVFWLIVRERRIPSEFFNINLAICETIFSLIFFIYLVYVLNIFPIVQLINNFLQGFTITGRPLFQCLMCVERYLAVVHPVTFLKYKPLRYRVICCAVVWIITLGSCLVSTEILTFSSLKAYTLFFSLQFLIFLCIQLFCLVAVLRALKQSGPGERNEENHMKRRAFHLILITTVTLVVMFSPFIITGFLTLLQQKEWNELSFIWFISFCCFILTGFVQPVLYLHRAKKLFFLCSAKK